MSVVLLGLEFCREAMSESGVAKRLDVFLFFSHNPSLLDTTSSWLYLLRSALSSW